MQLENGSIPSQQLIDEQKTIIHASIKAGNGNFRLISKRRKLVRKLFGKARKSPYLWSTAAANKSSFENLIKLLHESFWSKEKLNQLDSLVDSTQLPPLELTNAGEVLFLVAAKAYCPDSIVKIPDALEKVEPSLLFQLQEVELPLWECLLNESGSEFELARVTNRMESLVRDLLDGDGWPESQVYGDFGLLAASWCRCHRILSSQGCRLHEEVQSQLDWSCRQLLRSMRFDGSLVFSRPGSGVNSNAFRKALLEMSEDRSNHRIAANSFSKSRGTKAFRANRNRLPAESAISEWAQSGVLQAGWYQGSPKLGVLFGDNKIHLEVAHRFVIISGDSTPSIKINGKAQPMTSDIGVTCNLRFEHSDFVELEADYGNWTLQRQLLFLRDDNLLLIGDNFASKDESVAQIEYKSRFPVGHDAKVIAESENSEIYVKRKSKFALVIPLALPEWKLDCRSDRFAAENGNLILTQSINGRGLSAPLVVDLNPNRSKKPRTWRRLTVAEQMQTVGHDIASAYRLQIGKKQWLFYRSIVETGNRTFLGQNYADDFFVGRIGLDGQIKPLLEVE